MKATGIKSVLLSALVLLFSGCVSMSVSECQLADWRAIGYEDGLRGRASSQISEHRQACAKHGVVPDQSAYRTGYQEGVREYCVPEKGFELGKRGASYNGFCPEDLQQGFLEGYRHGKEQYKLKRTINGHRDKISRSKSRVKKLEQKVREREAALISDDTDKNQRLALLQQIKKDQKEIGELEAVIIEQEKLKAVKEAEFDKLQKPGY